MVKKREIKNFKERYLETYDRSKTPMLCPLSRVDNLVLFTMEAAVYIRDHQGL